MFNNIKLYNAVAGKLIQKGKSVSGLEFPLAPPSSNIWGWWDSVDVYSEANGGGTKIISDSTAIYSLKDLSGNGRHFNQSTASARALWKQSIVNGYPAIRFDGSNDYFEHTIGAPLAQPWTIYMVWKTLVEPPSNYSFLYHRADGYNLVWQYAANTITADSNGSGTMTNSAATAGAFHLLAYMQKGSDTSSYLTVDTTNFNGGSASGNTGDLQNFILLGGRTFTPQFVNFDLVELIIYSAKLAINSGDGLSARQYLNSKYGLGLGI